MTKNILIALIVVVVGLAALGFAFQDEVSEPEDNLPEEVEETRKEAEATTVKDETPKPVPPAALPAQKPTARLAFFGPQNSLNAETDTKFSYSFCKPDLRLTSDFCGGAGKATTDPIGGQPPYHFQLESGVGFPPIGMTLNLNGLLAGSSKAEGEYLFGVCAVDLAGNNVCQEVLVVVAQQLPPLPPLPGIAPAATGPETWTGTFTGNHFINDPASGCDGKLSEDYIFTFTHPRGLQFLFENPTATQVGELGSGTINGTAVAQTHSNAERCGPLEGGNVSNVPVGVSVNGFSKTVQFNGKPTFLIHGIDGKLRRPFGHYFVTLKADSIAPAKISGTWYTTEGYEFSPHGTFTMTKK